MYIIFPGSGAWMLGCSCMGWVGWCKKCHPEVFSVAPEAHQPPSTSKLVEQKGCKGICSDAWICR